MYQQLTTTVYQHGYIGAGMTSAERMIASTRRQEDDGPMSLAQIANARREVEYMARRNGIKQPLLQLWRC
ncbi:MULTISPECIES: hypothetical protein [Halomonadaceae]|uniref:hypothetical protein n=1 Tax=Halomonadaceae TaxID=28256 RepID=UPI00159872D7|nr:MULTISPECIES: hypothetical protein [Halomonas]QJQ96878.1 hypothetical protein HIO72_17390 [Halomonas sp. PA5]